MISVYDQAGLEDLRKQQRLDPRIVRRLRSGVFRSFAGSDATLNDLPDGVRQSIAAEVSFHALHLDAVRHSERDGASKLLFRTAKGAPIESVILRIKTGRSSLCISSQTGCAGGCLFCATGRLKGVANLSVPEILDQVVQAGERLRAEGRRLRNVVFMGMGEPFHNEETLFAALEELMSPGGFHLSPRHLLVSTMGVPEGIRRLSQRFPGVGLAVSLHSVRQEFRNELMPLTRRWPLPELRAAIMERNTLYAQPVMIELLMLDGVTDTEADAQALKEWLAGLQVHVNLIPYNPPPDTASVPGFRGQPLRASSPTRLAEFLADLKAAGYKATRRHSLGSDIQAACGQLAEQGAISLRCIAPRSQESEVRSQN